MNWKTDLKLSDLDASARIEITCRRCGLTHFSRAETLMQRKELTHAYLDEVERALFCASRSCHGLVRVALVNDDKTEGFVGGLA